MFVTATLIKQFFQYGCDRQIRYALISGAVRGAVPIYEADDLGGGWKEFGIEFEGEVVARLARDGTVLRAPPGEQLTEAESAAFLRGTTGQRYAHQLQLRLADPGPFRDRFRMPAGVSPAVGFPDLVEVIAPGGRPQFRLIDVKAVREPTVFHKAQLGFYALLLAARLPELGVRAEVDPRAEVWHLAPPGAADAWAVTSFPLQPYAAQVAEFLRRDLPRIVAEDVGPGRDETTFHVYYKCEQCKFLPHCARAVADGLPADRADVSAVPGLSQGGKQALKRLGVRTVADLVARPGVVADPTAGWSVRSRGPLLVRRARAIVAGTVARIPGRFSHRLPPRVHAPLYLAIDRDPVDGRVAALGCLSVLPGRGPVPTVAAVRGADAAAELAALCTVLSAAVEHLDAADRHNAQAPPDPWVAHVLVYEPSEAADLADALGRHLADDRVRSGLLQLVRMFPPEPLQPDPGYGGRRHLPATALRSVFDELYALPARVSHDLARVSAALAAADPPPAAGYRPGPPFARPFSSRLGVDVCRGLKEGTIDAAAVEADVTDRLTVLAALCDWVLADSGRAAVPFLRLKKDPFRWQAGFDPLTAGDLQVLEAQELLADRAAELQALAALAEPAADRVARLACLGPLTLVDRIDNPGDPYWAAARLVFRGPAEALSADLRKGAFGAILTDDDPDLRLDPDRWKEVAVTITDVEPAGGGAVVTVTVGRDAWKRRTLPRLLAAPAGAAFYLDRGHADVNTARLVKFFAHLAG
jgi:hypothetical protein